MRDLQKQSKKEEEKWNSRIQQQQGREMEGGEGVFFLGWIGRSGDVSLEGKWVMVGR